MSEETEHVAAEDEESDVGDEADYGVDDTKARDEEAEAIEEDAETGEDEAVESDLLARVSAHDEDLAVDVEERISDLESRLDEAEETIDERESQLKRAQADFQNYKKRAKKRQRQVQERATEDLVSRLLDVRDNLNRALSADHENVEGVLDGVEMTLREFDRVLDEEGVSEIAPGEGSEVDPQRHEVLTRVESDQPDGTIADVYQPGYEMADKVLRAAQVTVSDGTGEGGPEGSGDEATDDEEADDESGSGDGVGDPDE